MGGRLPDRQAGSRARRLGHRGGGAHRDRLDVWIGPDGGIGSTGWEGGVNNNRWGTVPIARPGVAGADSGIAAVARTPNRLDVCTPYRIGPDRGIGSTGWERGVNNNRWEADFPIARPGVAGAGSGIAAVARTPNRLDVFWIGPDGGIGSTGWEGGVNNNRWEADFPTAAPGAARAGSLIAAVSRTARRIDVFWIGPDGGIGTNLGRRRGRRCLRHAVADRPTGRRPRRLADRGGGAHAESARRVWIGPDGGMGSTGWERGVNNNK